MPTKDQLLAEAERLLKHVNVLDCGAHYCRYCPAKSPDWDHTPFCPYEQSQRDNDAARVLRAQIAAALSTPDTLPPVAVGDWVLTDGFPGGMHAAVIAHTPGDAARLARGVINEIRGTRNGIAFRWQRGKE